MWAKIVALSRCRGYNILTLNAQKVNITRGFVYGSTGERAKVSRACNGKGIGTRSSLTYKVEAEEILLDLKVLLRDYYAATFTKDENALKLQFNNGQTFMLSAKEV